MSTGTPWLGYLLPMLEGTVTTVSPATAKEEWSCLVLQVRSRGRLKGVNTVMSWHKVSWQEENRKEAIPQDWTPLLLPFLSLQRLMLVTCDDQLWSTGGLYLAVLPAGSLHPPVPLRLLCCDSKRRGFSDFMFVCFLSLAVGLDILNFGRTKR